MVQKGKLCGLSQQNGDGEGIPKPNFPARNVRQVTASAEKRHGRGVRQENSISEEGGKKKELYYLPKPVKIRRPLTCQVKRQH